MPHPRYFVNTNYQSLLIYSLTSGPSAPLATISSLPPLPDPFKHPTEKNPDLHGCPQRKHFPDLGSEHFDFLVIGGGRAGYAAARTAREVLDRLAIQMKASVMDLLGHIPFSPGTAPSHKGT